MRRVHLVWRLIVLVTGIGLGLWAETTPVAAAPPLPTSTSPAAAPTKAAADGLNQDGVKLYGQGKLREALDRFERAMAILRQIGDRKGEGDDLNNLGAVYSDLGQPQKALDHYQQALAIAREVGDRGGAANTLNNIGHLHAQQGQAQQALDYYQQALAIEREVGNRRDEGDTLNNIGGVYSDLGQPQKALDYYQQALTILREVGNRNNEGGVLNNIGQVYSDLGQPQKALDYFLQALPIAREVGDRGREGLDLENIGQAYSDLGQPQQALDYYQQALAILREVGDRQGEGTVLNNIGVLYSGLGQPQQALATYQQALVIRRDLDDRSGEAGTLHNIGAVYSDLDQSQNALDYFQQALAIERQVEDRRGEAATLFGIGQVQDNLGQAQQALDSYQQALATARAVNDRYVQGPILSNIGTVYASLGQRQKALESLLQALAIEREVGDRQNEGETLTAIGLTYVHVGQPQRALDYYQQALAIRRAVSDRRGEGTTLNNLGGVYYELGQPQRALDTYQEVLVIVRQVSDRPGEAVALNNIGAAYSYLGQPQRALDSYQQALAIESEMGDRGFQAATLDAIGAAYAQLGQPQKALESVQQALTIHREVGNRRGEGIALDNQAYLEEKQGDLAGALTSYQAAIKIKEALRTDARLEELKTSMAAQDVDVYQRTLLLLLRLARPADAFELSERARARTFLDQVGNARLDIRQGADSQLLSQEQSLRQELGTLDRTLRNEQAKPAAQQQSELLQSVQAQIAGKQKAYEALLTQLKVANPQYASLVSVDPLTLPQVQQRLGPDTTLVSYFVTPDKTVAFVVGHDAFNTVELPVKQSDLSAAIDDFRGFASVDAGPSASLQQIHAWLIAPLVPYLHTRRLIMVPHGILHYLPFAALTDGQHYLADDFTLFSLPSASALRFLAPKDRPGPPALLVAAYAQPKGLPRLAHAEEEAQAIAGLYHSQALVGDRASKAEVERRAAGASIVHLAAHGELNATSPLFSRILLADDGTSDGSLTVQDVYSLDLKQADLVVLSACQTELGGQSAGDDIVGLNRAFLYSGASSVLASLWSVDDAATGELMTAFYRQLQQGVGKAEALRAAQAEVRADSKHANPYYWAAFVLTGDPGVPAPGVAARIPVTTTPASGPVAQDLAHSARANGQVETGAAEGARTVWPWPVAAGVLGLGVALAVAWIVWRRRHRRGPGDLTTRID